MAKGKSGRKPSLKASLSSQQMRLKKKQEAAQAVALAEKAKQGSQKSRTKGKGKALTPRPIIPFNAIDRILLIGEGNFSFSRALVIDPPEQLEYLPASNVTATAYDTEEVCYSKYPDARDTVAALRGKGVEVVFGVDATSLTKCPALKGRLWDRIVWNFPHAGKGITDQDRNILSNQLLLLGFLRSAERFLVTGPIPSVTHSRVRKASDEDGQSGSEDEFADMNENVRSRGTILITLRNVPPYTLWDVPKLAKNPPPPSKPGDKPNPRYIQLRSFVFHRKLWQGYEHRMTKGERVHGQGKTGEGGEDRTWEFCLKD